MGFGRGSRSAGSRERKDIPPSSVRESCVVRGANNEDQYTFRNAAIDDGEPPLWVKTGKAQNEQIFSGFAPIVLQNSMLRCERAIIESNQVVS
jgi:hypothetical protein